MVQINKILCITIFIIFPLASCSLAKTPRRQGGFKVTLTPPTHPHSPFYPQILEANNITSTDATNPTLITRSQYLQWLITQMSNSKSGHGDIYYRKDVGHHIMEMNLGTPNQVVYGIFDTGSDLVWFQCEDRAGRGEKLPFYNHTLSHTYEPGICKDKMTCRTTKGVTHECQGGPDSFCDYHAVYNDNTFSNGDIGIDVTRLKPYMGDVLEVIFGCSKDNSDSMMGVIGASNNDLSLPRQLNKDDPKFSYCISDDFTKKHIVKFGSEAALIGQSLDMMRNSNYDFYYIDVVAIEVNGNDIDVKPQVFEMSDDGTRGFVIDSASSLIELTSFAYSALKRKVEEILGPASSYLMFQICYDSSKFGWWPKFTRPTISIEFTGFVFDLEEKRIWQKMPQSNLECLVVLRTFKTISILGYDALYNVNVGHDPSQNLLYLKKMACPTAFN